MVLSWVILSAVLTLILGISISIYNDTWVNDEYIKGPLFDRSQTLALLIILFAIRMEYKSTENELGKAARIPGSLMALMTDVFSGLPNSPNAYHEAQNYVDKKLGLIARSVNWQSELLSRSTRAGSKASGRKATTRYLSTTRAVLWRASRPGIRFERT